MSLFEGGEVWKLRVLVVPSSSFGFFPHSMHVLQALLIFHCCTKYEVFVKSLMGRSPLLKLICVILYSGVSGIGR